MLVKFTVNALTLKNNSANFITEHTCDNIQFTIPVDFQMIASI